MSDETINESRKGRRVVLLAALLSAVITAVGTLMATTWAQPKPSLRVTVRDFGVVGFPGSFVREVNQYMHHIDDSRSAELAFYREQVAASLPTTDEIRESIDGPKLKLADATKSAETLHQLLEDRVASVDLEKHETGPAPDWRFIGNDVPGGRIEVEVENRGDDTATGVAVVVEGSEFARLKIAGISEAEDRTTGPRFEVGRLRPGEAAQLEIWGHDELGPDDLQILCDRPEVDVVFRRRPPIQFREAWSAYSGAWIFYALLALISGGAMTWIFHEVWRIPAARRKAIASHSEEFQQVVSASTRDALLMIVADAPPEVVAHFKARLAKQEATSSSESTREKPSEEPTPPPD